MQGALVRISSQSREILRKLADEENESMQAILQKALEAYRRERLLAESNAAFAALKSNRKAWEEELRERKEWDVTTADGVLEG